MTSFAFHHVMVLLNVLVTPITQVVVDERARPLISMTLKMSFVEVKVTIIAMFGDDFWYITIAVRALDCKLRGFYFFLVWTTCPRNEWDVCSGAWMAVAPRIRGITIRIWGRYLLRQGINAPVELVADLLHRVHGEIQVRGDLGSSSINGVCKMLDLC